MQYINENQFSKLTAEELQSAIKEMNILVKKKKDAEKKLKVDSKPIVEQLIGQIVLKTIKVGHYNFDIESFYHDLITNSDKKRYQTKKIRSANYQIDCLRRCRSGRPKKRILLDEVDKTGTEQQHLFESNNNLS